MINKRKNAYPLINKKGRSTIKHCLISFYHNRNESKYLDSYYLIDVGDLEIINESELKTIIGLIEHKIMADDKDSLFSKYSVDYVSVGLPYYLDEEKHISSLRHKDIRDIELINYIKELMEKYKVSFDEKILEVHCFDISFPEWWFNDKLYMVGKHV